MKTVLSLFAWAAAVVGLSLLAIHAFLLEVWTVPTDDPMLAASIQPTLGAGDVVLVWRTGSFARGNLLRCPDPQAPGRFVIARAIAAPGDRLEIRKEGISLDGHGIQSPHACEQLDYSVFNPGRNDDDALTCLTQEYGDREFSALVSTREPEAPTQLTVAPGQWFLVSDNRHIHVDSRDYGPIDASACRHIVFRLASARGIADEKKRFTLVW